MIANPVQLGLKDLLSANQSNVKGKKHLISVGIDTYEECDSLKNSVEECKLLIDLMRSSDLYPDENITALFNEQATKAGIVHTLNKIWDNIGKGDSVMFHFSGHGYSDGNQNYLIPFDAKRENKLDLISSSFLGEFIRSSKAKNSLVIVNACFAGEVFKQSRSYDFLQNFTPKQEELYRKALDLDLNNQSYNFRNSFFDFLRRKDHIDCKDKFITFFYRQQVNKELPVAEDIILTSPDTLSPDALPDYKNHNHLRREVLRGNYELVISQLARLIEEHGPENFEKEKKNLIIKQLLKQKEADKIFPIKEIDHIDEELENALTIFKELGITVMPIPDGHDRPLLKEPGEKIRILFVQASPFQKDYTLFNEEVQMIEEELKRAKHRDYFEIEKSYDTTISTLQNKLLDFEPHIVHFKGSDDGKIHLKDHEGKSKVILPESLADLLGLFSDQIHCVILSSSNSNVNCPYLHKFIARVIGMKGKIDQKAISVFSAAFYKAIGAGRPVEFAFQLAVNSIKTNQLKGAEVPALT